MYKPGIILQKLKIIPDFILKPFLFQDKNRKFLTYPKYSPLGIRFSLESISPLIFQLIIVFIIIY